MTHGIDSSSCTEHPFAHQTPVQRDGVHLHPSHLQKKRTSNRTSDTTKLQTQSRKITSKQMYEQLRAGTHSNFEEAALSEKAIPFTRGERTWATAVRGSQANQRSELNLPSLMSLIQKTKGCIQTPPNGPNRCGPSSSPLQAHQIQLAELAPIWWVLRFGLAKTASLSAPLSAVE